MVSLLTLGQTWLLTKLLWSGAENEIETSAQICQSDMTNLIELIKLKKNNFFKISQELLIISKGGSSYTSMRVFKGCVYLGQPWEKHKLSSLGSGILLSITLHSCTHPDSCPPHPSVTLMSGDTRSRCRSLIWVEGSAGSCLVPGMGEAAWYAELQAQLTSSADRAEKKK